MQEAPRVSELTSWWSFGTRKQSYRQKEASWMMVTVQAGAGAASHAGPDWASIDWRQAERVVRRLQARIVQASAGGRLLAGAGAPRAIASSTHRASLGKGRCPKGLSRVR